MRRLAAVGLLLLAGCGSGGTPSATSQPSFTGSGFADCPAAVSGPPSGSPLAGVPALICMDGSGTKVRAGAATGRPTVVNLWGSWCPPCGKEMPVFVRLSARMGERLTVLGIDTSDSASNAVAAAGDYDVRYPNLYDPDGRVRTALKITGLPATVFVTAGGEVAYVYRGAPLTEAALAGLIAKHLGVAG